MIYLRAKSLTYRSMFAAGAEALTPEKLADLLTSEGTSTVVADPFTFSMLMVIPPPAKTRPPRERPGQ